MPPPKLNNMGEDQDWPEHRVLVVKTLEELKDRAEAQEEKIQKLAIRMEQLAVRLSMIWGLAFAAFEWIQGWLRTTK